VIERQLDQVDDQRPIVEDERATCVVGSPFHRDCRRVTHRSSTVAYHPIFYAAASNGPTARHSADR
jgi:hypothetical protein